MMDNSIKRLGNVIGYLLGTFALATILIQTFAVAARSLINLATPWSDEILRIMFIWLIFVCSAFAFLEGGLIRLDFVAEKLKRRPVALKILTLIQDLFMLVYSIFFTVFTYRILSTQITTGEATPILAIPLWLINLGFFVGSILFVLFGIFLFVKHIREKDLTVNK